MSGRSSDERPAPKPDESAQIPAGRRHTRRLEDKLLIAFHHACDVSDLEVAAQVLAILELMIQRRPVQPDSSRRRTLDTFVAAHERLWYLRHRAL